MRYSACIEMLFTDRPLVARVDAAAAAGCQAVEFWGLEGKDVAGICRRARALGLPVAACAVGAPLADPARHEESVQRLAAAIAAASQHGLPNLIVTSGDAVAGQADEAQEAAIVAALGAVASRAAAAGVRVHLEALNSLVDHPACFLDRTERAARIVAAVGSDCVRLLYDAYHAQIMEGNIIQTLRRIAPLLGYVHVAAVPGRTEPGDGELAYGAIMRALAALGYEGFVGLEFRPSGGAGNSGTAVRAALASLCASA